MKSLSLATSIAGLAGLVSGQEMRPDMGISAMYDAGIVHQRIMGKKAATWDRQRTTGAFDSSQWKRPESAAFVPCVNGSAAVIPGDALNTFRCSNIDFYDFRSHADLGSNTGEGAGSWGWTSPDGREFVAIGQADGAAFAEVTAAGKLVYLGRLPPTLESTNSIWREIKGFKNYMVIGSEAQNHGVQIFDMSKLLDIDPSKPVKFHPKNDLTGFFNGPGLPTGRSHNVVVNEEKNYAVAVGAAPRSQSCKGGLVFFDLTDPSKPVQTGCASGDGYVHDAQCIVYRGPDERYDGRDICYGYDEDTLTIFDVTDKNTTNIISRTSYVGASYTHQGWVLNPLNQSFLLLDDEYDEVDGTGSAASGYPITYIWDIRDLAAPKQTGFFQHTRARGIDHNQFVIDGFSYQSNYGSGLSVLDVRSVERDPTGKGVSEAGFFDIYPEDDEAGGEVEFVGTWSNYPFFAAKGGSGFLVVNSIERGVFVLKRRES